MNAHESRAVRHMQIQKKKKLYKYKCKDRAEKSNPEETRQNAQQFSKY